MRKKVLLGLGLVGVVMAIAVASVGGWVLSVWNAAASIDELKPVKQGATSVVYAADGSRLGYIQSDDIRQPVSASKMPDVLREATVAIEDRNFYEHGGIDYEAIIRAAVADIKAGEALQGGSTITQQLVRNLYISHPEDNIKRKIEEAKLADEYEQRYSKDQILTRYLNTASYGTIDGQTAVGVQAAAETYFSKPVGQLDLAEAALIAGLPQAPSEYNPLLNPDAALTRRNEVLKAMREQSYISESQYRQAVQAGLGLDRGYRYETRREPYFFDYVESQLIDRYGVNTVRKGGLRVYTTINPSFQAVARQAIAAHDYGGPARVLVSVDPSNGHIVAMASSQTYSASDQYNLAAEGHRQPGSSFKAFVLADAIDQGVDPYSTYYSSSSPMTLHPPDGGAPWTVNNAEPGTGGTMSLASATAESVNVVYAQLDLDLGPESVTQTAKAMGITSPLYSYPAEAIGGLTYGVSPLEMANAYATLADGGVRNTPTAIARVEFPNGDVDVPDEGERTRAFPDGVAYEETKVLKGVITGGTGTAANYGCPAAGKTGTTEDNSDAWFVGYTPRLSTAVWVGYPNARISLGSSGFGGTLAAPIWHDFMLAAHGGFCEDFPQPENPVHLEPFYGRHTVQRQYRYGYGSPSGTPYNSPKGGDKNGDGLPDQYYAPSPTTTTTTTTTTPNKPPGHGGTPPGHGGGGVGGGGG